MPVIVEVVGPPLRHGANIVRAGGRVEVADPIARALVAQGRAHLVTDEAARTRVAAPTTDRPVHHKKR